MQALNEALKYLEPREVTAVPGWWNTATCRDAQKTRIILVFVEGFWVTSGERHIRGAFH